MVRGFEGSKVQRLLLWTTASLAIAVFCVVQDRVTAAGARRYVALQRDALAGHGRPVTVDEVMQPAIDRSVRLGLMSSGAVAGLGVAAGLVLRSRYPDA